ncbi:ATP-grasp domain-containing protein [Desulfovermiculus halophilus]|uniref:ATP-grasp domain-containing protein n=1 Tax=Desulfovermiculus halophilus TaxID=339722 RepID=UPI000686EC1F|nr:ATP-grasp domain-containing protein [Desulfovermiculus halophilus]
MRLLEHEAKDILSGFRISTPQRKLLSSPDQERDFSYPAMMKVQIPIGGRGKAGGVFEVQDQDAAGTELKNVLGQTFRGYKPQNVLLEEKLEIEAEYFLSVIYDTVQKEPLVIFSSEGGVDIETLAREAPEKIHKLHISVRERLPEYKARDIVAEAGISGKALLGIGSVLSRLVDAFLDCDATVAEINPLVLSSKGQIQAADCHMEIDDDALFRHKDLQEMAKDSNRAGSLREQTDFERQAEEIDNLDHRGVAGRVIQFDGDIGLIIGGGGASLTAFDAVQAHGGKPANYCEIGGNPSVLKVKELTKLILSNPGVKKIAVIMNVTSNTRVDLVARGIVKGVLELERDPAEAIAVFRIPGAWEEEGFQILKKYGITFCDRTVSIDEAAKIAVANMSN